MATARTSPLESRDDGRLHLHLKVVPGASRDGLMGAYGDRLKVRVAAAAESGKANKAVLGLLAAALDVPVQQLELMTGHANPRKTVAIDGMALSAAAAMLGLENA